MNYRRRADELLHSRLKATSMIRTFINQNIVNLLKYLLALKYWIIKHSQTGVETFTWHSLKIGFPLSSHSYIGKDSSHQHIAIWSAFALTNTFAILSIFSTFHSFLSLNFEWEVKELSEKWSNFKRGMSR